ncbi:MAG: magnesium-translocating P-type ATPase [Meiothermus sp.]|nr:magnesium-translocating P-type ATPase [Meiothermus sp.]
MTLESQSATTTLETYWSHSSDEVLYALGASTRGLSSGEAAKRLRAHGPNRLKPPSRFTPLRLLLNQFRSPMLWILIFAAVVSAIALEWVDAAIVLSIVAGSALLSFRQEYRANSAIQRLLARVSLKATVLRDGVAQAIAAEAVVPGDVVLLSAGSLIPTDGLLIEATDCFVNQAVLSGESFPVEKVPGIVPAQAGLPELTNCLFMGTSVRSGTARMLVVNTGTQTAYGQIARRLSLRPPETEFEQGLNRFGYLLTQIIFVLVVVVLSANLLAQRAPIESLLFAIALAVGIAPELLPAIVSLNLSQGAQHMAAHGVIVRRLSAIEDFGSMQILCTDKTGTLTEGVVSLESALDAAGQPSDQVLHYAYLNATFQTGLGNTLDETLVREGERRGFRPAGFTKLGEVPYDFERKRLSIVVEDPQQQRVLITKGAFEKVLEVCGRVQIGGENLPLEAGRLEDLQAQFQEWSRQGFRVLGVASRVLSGDEATLEQNLCFLGFLQFSDRPKAGIQNTIAGLKQLGVQLKIITGDNRTVTQHLARQVGLEADKVLSGAELNALSDEALWHQSQHTSLFVEVDPNQKERIILALQKMGFGVGYLGDGINDAPALHAADVGISVDQAVDVAKEAADLVLLEHDLEVLKEGIEEGRKTFANTLKYIFITTSANFGNMLSMAVASLGLPFLPLLAKQILLNNFLSDFPAMTIASDSVDREWVERPQRWDLRLIRNFMLGFGLVSSAFDFLTFGLLLWVFRAGPEYFRTGWFVESLLTELVVILIVRTRRPFYRSRPSTALWVTSLAVSLLALSLPYWPFAALLGFVPLPPTTLLTLVGITGAYALVSEITKSVIFRRHHRVSEARP